MNLKSLILLIFSTSIFLFHSSCDLYDQNSYNEQYVIEAYLTAQNNLPPVRVSTTLPSNQTYTFENAALDSAKVSISRIGEQGAMKSQTTYHQPDTGSSGYYYPVESQNQKVQALSEYKLEVLPPNASKPVIARTFVPDTFTVQESANDTITYQATQQIETIISPIRTLSLDQSHFIFTVISRNPQYDNLTPFYKDQTDDESDISAFIKNDSGIINEGNFDINQDGTISLKLPWLGFAFYQDNAVVTSSIDKNLYDFIRSQSVQTGGSTLSPGEIQNVIYHVENGIGVFGSMSSDTIDTYLARPF